MISFFDALRQVAMEKGIPEERVMDTINQALVSAYKKKYKVEDEIETAVEQDGNKFKIFVLKNVVEAEGDPAIEIEFEEAKAIMPDVTIGDKVKIEIKPETLGRIAAQTAKQIFIQSLQNIEKDMIYDEFKQKEGEIISGDCQRKMRKDVYISLGRAEGILPEGEQSTREHFRVGERVKALILSVEKGQKGPIILLSRANTEFVKKLFAMEVPEIYDKSVEIKSIAREPGYRTKIAVHSSKEGIDSVGACVGMKGIRIRAVVQELEGEKIDVLKWSNDINQFIKNVFSPIQVKQILADKETDSIIVVVPKENYNLVVGKTGQNVRLASRLAGINIDVKTEEQYREYLKDHGGLMDVESLFKVKKEEKIDKLEKEKASVVKEEKVEKEVVKEEAIDNEGGKEEVVVESQEEFEYESEEEFSLEDLPDLSKDVIKKLKAAGYDSIETLIDSTKEDLMEISGIGEKTADQIVRTIQENVEIVEE